MTIHSQLRDRSPGSTSLSDRPTRTLETRHPLAVDPFSLLDHRTRARAVPQQLAPPGRYLSIEDGDDTQLIPLDRPITHIGRGLAADVRIEDPHVSRRHAIIAHRGDGARVLDDRSSNGTFVNGRTITVSSLADGDVLRLGRVVFRFVEVRPRASKQPLRRISLVRRGRHLQPVPLTAA